MTKTRRVMLAIFLTSALFPSQFVPSRAAASEFKKAAPTLQNTAPQTGQTSRKKAQRRRRIPAGAVTTTPNGAQSRVARLPVTHTVTVNPDGTFNPAHLRINRGDTVRWENLGRTDAVVQIGNPNSNEALGADVCGINDNKLDHAFAGSDSNEFTGPTRYGVSGIFCAGL